MAVLPPAAINQLSRRFILFDDVQMGCNLIGSELASFVLRTRKSCSAKCLITPSCKSYSFCNSVCQLKFRGVHEVDISDDNIWLKDSNCVYVGMRKETSPECVQLGSFVDIKNDFLVPNICQINHKRVDCQTGPPSYTVIDTPTEWKRFTEYDYVLENLHGGRNECQAVQIEEWFVWVSTEMTFPDAQDYCESIGGQIFGDINGTAQQFDFLYHKQNGQNFWLGITDRDVPDVYKSLNGIDVTSYLKWAWQGTGFDEPSRLPEEFCICACMASPPYAPAGSYQWFHDAGCTLKFRFPCILV
ncbi:uncharacterized protein LOC142340253 [Convolutriloba macropyga]|uniref:uncharacterized protein LOC142340253 n=1 Tax=Convolutriloba macropyga TaxID=536237 RepID=UPI003F522616